MTEEQPERVEISWVQVSASALAAVSSAVLLSTVGVAGTLIGAAVGSVVATVGNAVYAHYLSVSRARVAAAQAAALERVTRARSGASAVWADSRRNDPDHGPTTTLREEQAHDELDRAEHELDEVAGEAPAASWRDAFVDLPWKRIAAVAGGIFVVAMLVIVSFELLTGRAVSTYTGGSDSGGRTSIPGLGSERDSRTPDKEPTPTQDPTTPESSATTEPTPTPIETSPSTPTTPTPSDHRATSRRPSRPRRRRPAPCRRRSRHRPTHRPRRADPARRSRSPLVELVETTAPHGAPFGRPRRRSARRNLAPCTVRPPRAVDGRRRRRRSPGRLGG